MSSDATQVNAQDAERVLSRADLIYDQAAVGFALDQMSVRMSVALADANPLLLCIMNGGLRVTSELSARMRFPLTLDYLHVTRYRGVAGGELQWLAMPQTSLEGRTVVLVDDILDLGITLAATRQWAVEAGGERVLTAVLIDKQLDPEALAGRTTSADFTALEAPDRYLFGCGMDWCGYWRNLPEVYALHPEDG